MIRERVRPHRRAQRAQSHKTAIHSSEYAGSQSNGLGRLKQLAVVQTPVNASLRATTARRLPNITVLIPAHNEAATIAQTIRSIRTQSLRATSVTVVCDNCTDDTAEVAARAGARVLETAGNSDRKAGALNQALTLILPSLRDSDYILAMDADSLLLPGWIEGGTRFLEADAAIGAVCGAFLGEPGHGLIGQVQRNEYYRYARIMRRRVQAQVLSGTGTLFRVSVLRQIARERGRSLPGVAGLYYNPKAITEDDEITLAVKTLGWKCLCPKECETVTEVMPTWSALWVQRMRWQEGALRDLTAYGLTDVTRWYWLRQAGLYVGFAASWSCMAVMAGSLATSPGISIPWTVGVLSIAVVERTWTVRHGGWRAMLFAAVLLPETVYSLWRSVLFFDAVRARMQKREIAWGHLSRDAGQS